MGEAWRGYADYLLKPWLRSGDDLYSSAWRGTGPLNGQQHRQATTLDILREMDVKAIVETGTYRGITTEFFAQQGVPVITIETNERLAAYSRLRLRRYRNVTVITDDSGARLEHLGAIGGDRVFFYLDAHWDAQVPIREELAAIADNFTASVVMIDDFQVPGDSYVWLDRGPGRRLNYEALAPWPDRRAWYPAAPAWTESGQGTGWVVLAQNNTMAAVLDNIEGLRRRNVVHDELSPATRY
jgi:hypothetical protein